MPARAALTLHFGDELTRARTNRRFESNRRRIGNSTEQLNQTQLIPIFLGFWLGVIVGSIPVPVPGSAPLSASVSLAGR